MTKTDDALLVAVERMTKPIRTQLVQTNRAGIRCKSEITLPSLLEQLRDAIVGGIGHHAGGSGSDRLPFDADAACLYRRIALTINQWADYWTGTALYANPEAALSAWHLSFSNAHRAGIVTDLRKAWFTSQLVEWGMQIEAKFDPATRVELAVTIREPVMEPVTVRRVDRDTGERVKVPVLDEAGEPVMRQAVDRSGEPRLRVVRVQPASCPECGERHATDMRTADRIPALAVEFHTAQSALEAKMVGMCRFCGETWEGDAAVAKLIQEVDAEETRLNTRPELCGNSLELLQ